MGIRTPVTGVKSPCPRPLDDGGVRGEEHRSIQREVVPVSNRLRKQRGGGIVAGRRITRLFQGFAAAGEECEGACAEEEN